MSDTQVRVMLWCVPRSLSTAFEKCISAFTDTQVINEVFNCAHHAGPERVPEELMSKEDEDNFWKEMGSVEIDLPMAFKSDQCTYAFAKSTLEADYPGKRLVFGKDMAYSIDRRYELLPKGYRHTFLIRNPHRTFPSFRKVFANWMEQILGKKEFRICDLPESWIAKNYGVQEQCELVEYLGEHGEPDPIVIDADDLLREPASVLKQYCACLGIEFSDDRLEWVGGLDAIKNWIGSKEMLAGDLHDLGGYYSTALNSTRFNPPKEMPRREDLSEDILKCVDYSMPYYQKMYDLRIKP